ncbi:hypothetical protein KSP39_PZI001740 [Platanthera zijinensis]|uniref:Uncharacterized protein n=1 Tax=Platanthera zijinensis TaxID=2320716 RepID=A0AAP0C0A8_9ASPA
MHVPYGRRGVNEENQSIICASSLKSQPVARKNRNGIFYLWVEIIGLARRGIIRKFDHVGGAGWKKKRPEGRGQVGWMTCRFRRSFESVHCGGDSCKCSQMEKRKAEEEEEEPRRACYNGERDISPQTPNKHSTKHHPLSSLSPSPPL